MHPGLMPDGAILEVRHLVKDYETKDARLRTRVARAVDRVSFGVAPGETFAVVGESGSGKSTLGRVLLHLTPATSGSIRFSGDELLGLGERRFRPYRRQLQMVFQDPLAAFDPRRSIRSSLREFAELAGQGDRQAQDAAIDAAIEDVGLRPVMARRRPGQVSGGQLQRLSVARALLVSPSLVFLDEPTSALDVSIRGQVVNLLLDRQDRDGVAYLLVAHDLRVVSAMAHRVAVMYLGQLVEVGSRDTVYSTPRHPYTRGLLRAAGMEEAARDQVDVRLTGELSEEHARRTGCRLAPRCPFAEARCDEPQELQATSDGQLVRCWKAVEVPETIGLRSLPVVTEREGSG